MQRTEQGERHPGSGRDAFGPGNTPDQCQGEEQAPGRPKVGDTKETDTFDAVPERHRNAQKQDHPSMTGPNFPITSIATTNSLALPAIYHQNHRVQKEDQNRERNMERVDERVNDGQQSHTLTR